MKKLLEAINRGILRGLNENNNMNLLTNLDDNDLDLLDPLLTKSINNKIHALYKYFPKTKEELIKIIKEEVKKNGLNCNLNHIGTSKITDMSYLFINSLGRDLGEFNGDISRWDVSNVTNMSGMFDHARSFNRPIGSWDVSSVTDMSDMFAHAYSFNQPIGGWDVSNVVDMSKMFCLAESFNLPIGDWDVSNVKTMQDMFYMAEKFNQPIGEWDVSNVENMLTVFAYAYSFNQDLSSWKLKDTCKTTHIFFECLIKKAYKPKKRK